MYIELGLHISDDMALKSVTFNLNTTDLPSDGKLLKVIAITILESLSLNKDSVMVQDLLSELGIDRAK